MNECEESVLLKKGITGFFEGNDVLAETDFKEFKKACFALKSKGYDAVKICSPRLENYFYAYIKIKDKYIYMLLNKYYPTAGFVRELSFGNKVFVDVPELQAEFSGYDLIGSEILNSGFNNAEHVLAKCELEQIRYYSPSSVGNIIFNEWD